MNERAAKMGVWAHFILTLASFILSLYLLLFWRHDGTLTFVLIAVWLGYLAYTLFRGMADLLGPQRRMTNFTRMLDRWQDAFGKRSSALALLTFMTLIVGAIKILIPILIMQL